MKPKENLGGPQNRPYKPGFGMCFHCPFPSLLFRTLLFQSVKYGKHPKVLLASVLGHLRLFTFPIEIGVFMFNWAPQRHVLPAERHAK